MVGQSEIGLLGVHSRLEQTAHIFLHTTPTQNEMNTNAFFFFISHQTWPRLKPNENMKTVNMLKWKKKQL